MELFTRAAVNDIFDREKVLLGVKEDGVPQERAAELFGWDAVKKVIAATTIPGFTWGSMGGGICLYRSGFLEAAVYYNRAQLNQGDGLPGNENRGKTT